MMMGGVSPPQAEKTIRKKKVILDFGGVKNRQNDDGIKYVITGGGQKIRKS